MATQKTLSPELINIASGMLQDAFEEFALGMENSSEAMLYFYLAGSYMVEYHRRYLEKRGVDLKEFDEVLQWCFKTIPTTVSPRKRDEDED